MTAPHSASPDRTTRKTLNLIQVAAAALAAVTAAVLSSSLGATGTLIGAAGASVITTVATNLYQQSLERSRDRVRRLARRTRGSSMPQDGPDSDLPRTLPATTPPAAQRSWRSMRPRWGSVALGALGAFVLAMLAVTSFEWASGEAVGGNGTGTTIGEVLNDQPAPRHSPATPEPGLPLPGTPTSTPTETPADTPTETTTPGPSINLGPNDDSGSTTTSEEPSRTTTPPRPLVPGLPGVGG